MREKICFVVSTPHTAKSFLTDHIAALSQEYDVTLVANYSGNNLPLDFVAGVAPVDIKIVRNINVYYDLISLLKLYHFFRSAGFIAVHSVTPKAGLLAMLAATFAGVRFRFHTFTGQVWATKSGIFRLLLKMLDKLIYVSATHVLVDSPSQRDFLVSQGVVIYKHSTVLGDGSIAGVDTRRFKPDPLARESLRNHYGLPQNAFIFLFLGRMNVEKGIAELVEAFSLINFKDETAYLLLVGPDEDDVLESMQTVISSLGHHFLREGYTSAPEYFMAAADVFCLPSHREGFGTVILESAASGVPSIGSNIYGISDAIEDGHTGLLHEVRDVADLSRKMAFLLSSKSIVEQYGRASLVRASSKFSCERVVQEMVAFYRKNVQS